MPPLKKCIVWDLDDTLWDGVYLEGDVTVRPEARLAIEELDRRGVLHSIASRGEEKPAIEALRAEGLLDFFLAPQINWEPKPKNILTISEALHLALDAIIFIDDDRFEREQVSFMLPDVMTIEACSVPRLVDHPCLRVEEVTEEARSRRHLYMAEQQRQQAERTYSNREAFLRSCAMELTLRPMAVEDTPRVVELMSRTHQLNTVGRVLESGELAGILNDKNDRWSVTVAELADRFGGYGTVGAAIVEHTAASWRLCLLAVSCRVLGRGVERAILAALLREARKRGLSRAEALYRDTGRNRAMRALYQMMGFRADGSVEKEGTRIFSVALDRAPAAPGWIQVT
jgi:FkbH-like protein